jgi:flagellar M-ring protein FliF
MVAGGIPGTASNLPNPPKNDPNRTPGGVTRRTENITYQTSRLVRTTRIPQGVVRRMSLAVLVDQAVQWEGEGSARRKVLVAPAPETLKSIRDVVAGVTGYNEERGDQLIVESLPFESSLNAAPPASNRPAPKPPKEPPLLEFYHKYQDLAMPASVALMVAVALLVFVVWNLRRRKPGRAPVKGPGQRELPAAAPDVPGSLPVAEGPPANIELSEKAKELAEPENPDILADRIRQTARRDPAATANVLRMWLEG